MVEYALQPINNEFGMVFIQDFALPNKGEIIVLKSFEKKSDDGRKIIYNNWRVVEIKRYMILYTTSDNIRSTGKDVHTVQYFVFIEPIKP